MKNFSVQNLPEQSGQAVVLPNIPAGGVAQILADILVSGTEKTLVYIAPHLADAYSLRDTLGFFMPDAVDIRIFPAWDCAPYDRSSPSDSVQTERARLLHQWAEIGSPSLVMMPVNAFLSLVPPLEYYQELETITLQAGYRIAPENLVRKLSALGMVAVDMVHRPGEFVRRGGLIDLFPSGYDLPVRLDFFGDEIESMVYFDPLSQRRLESACDTVGISPGREVILSEETIQRFRQGYREAFGLTVAQDPLFAALSAGQCSPGMEHALALFHDRLSIISQYFPNGLFVFGKGSLQSAQERFTEISDYYAMRHNRYTTLAKSSSTEGRAALAECYKPLAPESMYLNTDRFSAHLHELRILSFDILEELPRTQQQDYAYPVQQTDSFVAVRALGSSRGVLEELHRRADIPWRGKIKIVATGQREEQIRNMLEQGGFKLRQAANLAEAKRHAPDILYISTVFHRGGFETERYVVLDENELLGGEETARASRSRQARSMILDMTTINAGDLVTHIEHGIGRYLGLSSISADNVRHECLKIEYAEGGLLYLPVENIELVSLYGEADADSRRLDRLGQSGWQARKARVRGRIKDIAEKLIALAAKRQSVAVKPTMPDWDQYARFKQNIAFTLTDDQQGAINDVIDDLERGYPMDRLICGDVGFGKTEIAMHAIFITAYNGGQVALLAPTTLLAQQHYRTLEKRLRGFGFEMALRSRTNTAKEASDILEHLESGALDIVVGTHALLGKRVKFKNLQLFIVDEEQRFGVTQKETLKNLRTEVHVLSLSATPIPRTLNMALSGVRDLSVIATPPVDRLAIRTLLEPFDEVSIERALMREKDRAGQSYFVTPRIKYLAELETILARIVPELNVATVHGRMNQEVLDTEMQRFVDGEADILLATSIIESGLDVTNANTMLVHRPDLFGLSQLYQIRGRIGRGALRANCYLCLPKRGEIHQNAARRLEVLQTLDSLGAGFTLAHHDMDLRGAGNLVGAEQSGHMNEVGVELYQRMLVDALEALKKGEDWNETIQEALENRDNIEINLGISIGIPEDYISDIATRLSLYRRIARLENDVEIQAITEDLRDRFGTLPQVALNLLSIIQLKILAKSLRVQKIDAGTQGVAVKFFEDHFSDGDGLVRLLMQQPKDLRITQDHRLIYSAGEWGRADKRVGLTLKFLHLLQTVQ